MKAAVFVSDKNIELQEFPDPKPGPDEVLIKVAGCGVCGTDVHIFSGEHRVAKPPVILGHEITGSIVELGENITRFKTGQTISVDPVVSCGQCEFCHIGQPNLCNDQTTIGYIKNGGFAQYTVVPASHIYTIDKKLGIKAGVLVETLACVLNGFDRIDMKAGKSVMILGAGTVGLLWNQLIKHSLSTLLIQTELVDSRRNLAKKLGADYIIDPRKQNLLAEVLTICPDGIDYIIDATGDPEAVEQAIPIVRKTGTFLIFGICPDDVEIRINPNMIYEKEMKIIASKMPPRTLDRAVKILEAGLIDYNKIVNQVFPLEKIETAFSMFENSKDKAVKIVIDPWR